jgi:inosine-uridine nucleoside N-ribohydrolase
MKYNTMKKTVYLLFFAIIAFLGCTRNTELEKTHPARIIFDTDLGPDYDDVGALAFLHAMSDSGKVNLIATVASNKDNLVAPSIDVINTYFDRPGLIIGAPKTAGVSQGSSQHWADSIVAKYPHNMKSTDDAPDAVKVYRRVLSQQPDSSVTIITAGFLTNLCNLLKSQADDISPLNGIDLIRKKIKLLVSMAGRFPEGKEFNLYMDSTSSKYVFENWPGKVIFTGYEIGEKIKTGRRLIQSPVYDSPVKDVFRISMPLSEEDRYGRMSWDETAALIGVYGTSGFFDTVSGKIIVNDDGSNSWENMPDGKQSYVVQKMPVYQITKFIEDRMMHVPINKRGNALSRSISPETLKDKIAGGWAGKMIGVTYGAPTEFRAQGKIYTDPVKWTPSDVKGSIWQDDIYVQLTFLMSMDKYGMDAPAKKFQEMFARAGYPLWHANMQARKNYYDSIFAPRSGNPLYNIHADDIDFQIEADYIGFMCPGMPRTAAKIADKIGHIMNYGDGVYGGIFVSALYSWAYFDNNIPDIINKALQSIPSESDYYRIINDVIALHSHYPDNWQLAWKELWDKWGYDHICSAGTSFNIDAKLNGAFIVMGLLYGDGDPARTLEITTRCGQDSDCNPSNAMAVLGVIKGFSGLPHEMQRAVSDIGDSVFINTTYSYNTAVKSTYRYAIDLIKENGGSADDKNISVMTQPPDPPAYEVSFPGLVFDRSVSIFESKDWTFKGDWKPYEIRNDNGKSYRQSLYAEKEGDELGFSFTGTGISLTGNWFRDGGKADVYVDGILNRSIDTYYYFADQQHTESIWHVTGLKQGDHKVRLVVKGKKRPESDGTRVYITQATIFRTGAKKSETYKFSFEH